MCQLLRLSVVLILGWLCVCPLWVEGTEFVPVCGRSTAVKKYIEDEMGRSCDHISETDLVYLDIMFVDFAPEDQLKCGDFSGLHNVAFMRLRGFHGDLPGCLFEGLGKLHSLTIYESRIVTWSVDLFSGLPRLRDLDLSSNDISALPAMIFRDLGILESLDLSGNKIEILHELQFLNLRKLKSLNLSSSGIIELPESIFHGLTNLEILNFSSNRIARLSENLFRNLGNLVELYFFDNPLITIPKGIFSPLKRLEVLKFGSKTLGHIPDNSITKLERLRILNISQSPLDMTHKAAFKGFRFTIEGLPDDFDVDSIDGDWTGNSTGVVQ